MVVVLREPVEDEEDLHMGEALQSLEAGVADLSVAVTQKYFAMLPELHSLGVDDATMPMRGAAE